jgi:hypothetical protein
MTCFQVWKIRTTAIGHSVRTLGEWRARANGEFGICWDVGVGAGGGGADESLAGVGGLGEGARPAEGYLSVTCHVIEKNELTGGLRPLPPLSPNSFSTTVFVFAYIDLTKSKNGSTNGSASSYSISLFTSARMVTDLMSPKPINHDFDTNQCILLILGLDQFDHQTHDASFEWLEWIGMR